ncbi:sensor histidine kinase [Yinghuangia seranimata]|uniref:sensor histidine kinase n=1 Tax=Yinghuangia seranimata TaxID=408067 RepID=UPI00248C2E1F|nr:sensor histidine kinase [Yinghuangia seranimata]MDI2130909.1 sensor histidine kinase [Yinghuangia seranimata]
MGFGPASTAATAEGRPETDGRFARFVRDHTDLLIALVATVVDLLGYVLTLHPEGTTAAIVSGVAVAGAGMSLVARRRAPLLVLGVVLGITVAVNVAANLPPRYSIAQVVALFTVGLMCRPVVAAGAAVATLAAQATGYPNQDASFAWTFSGDLVATLLVLAVSAGVRHWQAQVDVNRELLAERALTDERRRIARELHDIVAHHVTTMHLMSGAARANLDRDPEASRSALLALEASGRVALGEMRQLLGVLRSADAAENAPSAPQPGVDDLDRLVAESCLAGLPTEFEVTGEPHELSLPVGLALYRITQEALTNTRKHAGTGATATVHLDYRDDRVALAVRDRPGTQPGSGAGRFGGHGVAGAGHGLLGMRERVAVHGGTFAAGPADGGGFLVEAAIPVLAGPPRSRPTRATPGGPQPATGPDGRSTAEIPDTPHTPDTPDAREEKQA